MTTDTATRFFIAVPADPQGVGIFGIGQTANAALADAYAQSNTSPPVIDFDGDYWTVRTDAGTDVFANEGDANRCSDRHAFTARECTERLYREVEAHGCDANSFRWTRNAAGLDDLYEEDAAA